MDPKETNPLVRKREVCSLVNRVSVKWTTWEFNKNSRESYINIKILPSHYLTFLIPIFKTRTETFIDQLTVEETERQKSKHFSLAT